uniref:Uncharacterized protein n=1 Tax=Anolis carolinensis TaxID=28377 RepID=H9GH77_ANOCA
EAHRLLKQLLLLSKMHFALLLQVACQQYGQNSHLASFLSAQENTMVAQFIIANYPGIESVWIGFHDPKKVRTLPFIPACLHAWPEDWLQKPSCTTAVIVLHCADVPSNLLDASIWSGCPFPALFKKATHLCKTMYSFHDSIALSRGS